MNDVGSNLLVNYDLSIINKVARPYHYLEHNFDLEDFGEADAFWDDLFPGTRPLDFISGANSRYSWRWLSLSDTRIH